MHVDHLPDQQRFVLTVEGHEARLFYRRAGDRIDFVSTVVPGPLEGRGLGSHLVRAGLEFARQERLRVRSGCWFVTGWIDRHPEFADLLG